VVVGPREPMVFVPGLPSDELIYKEFCRMTITEASGRRAALSAVAKKYGRSAKSIYAIVERLKKPDPDPA
jgi:Mor family transcriptional regulator